MFAFCASIDRLGANEEGERRDAIAGRNRGLRGESFPSVHRRLGPKRLILKPRAHRFFAPSALRTASASSPVSSQSVRSVSE